MRHHQGSRENPRTNIKVRLRYRTIRKRVARAIFDLAFVTGDRFLSANRN
jgi:hypothetical protein